MGNSDDNQDLEDEETTEGEEEETSTDGEEDAEGEGDGTDADKKEGEDGEGDDAEGDSDEEGADGKKKFVIPEKFKGKSVEDIAKSYTELEKSIQKKATEMAREMIGKQRGGKVTKEDDKAIKEAMKGVDFSKMKPEDFAAWLIKTVEARAQEIARNTYEAADSTKTQVQTEIAAVTKTWPQLKENEGFRDMVLTLIENAANKGDILTLKEACAKVGKAMGLKPGQKKTEEDADADGEGEGEEEAPKKKKLGVERGNGAGGGEKKTEEEQVLEGLRAGGRASGGIGNLW